MTVIKDSTDKLAQLAHSATQDDADYVLRHRTWTVSLTTPAGASSTKPALFYCEKAVRLKIIKLLPLLAMSAHASNHVTLTFGHNDGAGGTITALTTAFTTDSDVSGYAALVVGTAIPILGITDADTIAAGKYLACELAIGGTNTALDVNVQVELEYL